MYRNMKLLLYYLLPKTDKKLWINNCGNSSGKEECRGGSTILLAAKVIKKGLGD